MGIHPGPIVGVPAADADQSWAIQGLCTRGYDPELFFPAPTAVEQTRAAARVCGRCPVQGECLAWALATNQQFGVWGGKTEGERQAIRAKRARDAKHARRRARKQAS